MEKRAKTSASRRNFLLGLFAGVGASALALGSARAQDAKQAKNMGKSGPVLFHRTAETEKYYKTLTRS